MFLIVKKGKIVVQRWVKFKLPCKRSVFMCCPYSIKVSSVQQGSVQKKFGDSKPLRGLNFLEKMKKKSNRMLWRAIFV